MTYITTDSTTDKWVIEKKFYKLIPMEDEFGNMVNIKQFIWWFEKSYLEDLLIEAEKNIADIKDKLSFYK